MSTTQKKTIIKKSIQFPTEKLTELLIAHLYATSYLDDDDEVIEAIFKSGVDLKNKIRVDLKLYKTKNQEPEQLTLLEE